MTPAPCPSTLLIVAGQSNALGFGVDPAELPDDARALDPLVRIWTDGAFVTLRPGVNTGTARCPSAWGPEVAFARRWRRDHPEAPLHVVKVAKGEAGLAGDPVAADWSPGSGKLFAEMSAAVSAARAVLPPPIDTIILWAHGETDARDPAKATAYAANLGAFRVRAVDAWGCGEAAFLVGRINGVLFDGSPVRAAQDLHGAYSTDGFPLQADQLHLSGAGQILSGSAAYEAWRRHAPPGAKS